MFIGEYHHKLDEKGRVAIPTKYRAQLKGGAVVTRGLDKSLFVYPGAAWDALAKKLASLPLSQKNTRAFVRLMLAGAMDVGLDRQGRIIVPGYLRIYAGLKKQAVVAGVYDRMEIWDQKRWQRYRAGTEKRSDEIAEKLGELGV